MRLGASLLGFVEAEGSLDLSTVRLGLEPAATRVDDPSLRDRLKRMERSSTADSRGFFQFTDLIPGSYFVTAEAPGQAPLRAGPFPVEPGMETNLGSNLLMRPGSRVAIWVSPPTHPGHDVPWSVEMVPSDPALEIVKIATDDLGLAQGRGLAAGRYSVRVGADDGELWFQEERRLIPGDQTWHVDLPLVAISGTISRGGEPVRARLSFAPVDEDGQVLVYSDFEGRFSGFLPEAGAWNLHLLYEAGGSQHFWETLEIAENGEEIHIDLPETVLWGKVVDPEGSPVENASVSARRSEEDRVTSSAQTDSNGKFSFFGLAEGTYSLDAVAMSRSGHRKVTLEESRPTPTTIAVHGDQEIQGQVLGPFGPVAGAVIHARPTVDHPRLIVAPHTVTDPLGRFSFRVPEDTSSLDLLVLPYGYAATLLTWRQDELTSEQLEISVDSHGGSLTIRSPEARTGRSSVVLRKGATEIPLNMLENWIRFHRSRTAQPSGEVVLPEIAAGQYQVCRSPGSLECDEGVVLRGHTTDLSVP